VCEAPAGEHQPSTEVDLFVSAEKLMILNTSLQVPALDLFVSAEKLMVLNTSLQVPAAENIAKFHGAVCEILRQYYISQDHGITMFYIVSKICHSGICRFWR